MHTLGVLCGASVVVVWIASVALHPQPRCRRRR